MLCFEKREFDNFNDFLNDAVGGFNINEVLPNINNISEGAEIYEQIYQKRLKK